MNGEGEGLENGASNLTMPIAIIGMSCRFPSDATSPEKLWELCSNSRSAWSGIPDDRFSQSAFYHPNAEKLGATNVRGGHFMEEDVSVFDASFFNLSSDVAASMDPQLRLLLESTFEALEDAGIPVESVSGTQTSVFTAAFTKDHHDSLMRDPETLPRYFMTGNGTAMLSNRISHFFDLKGPSISLDTACSSSMACLHLACQSLRVGDSNVAIVGGANLILNPDMFIAMSSLGFLSPDGKCYAFDSRAAGYGRGEGVASIVIKPLDDALRDNDNIRAVIRETALGQDGKTPTLTSPSQEAQESLIRLCYKKAGIDPLTTDYVEAHGTGTQVGDPVEASAIAKVFGEKRSADDPILIGSVKTNIGHLEGVSGLAGVIKVVMALEKGFIPPNINFEKPNEKIDPRKWKIKIPTKLEPWPSRGVQRASISSFGYGGLNAHAIIDNFTPSKTSPSARSSRGLTNGHSMNGHSVNGHSVNGHSVNGHSVNGHSVNGHSVNGHSANMHARKPHVFTISAKDETAISQMKSNLVENLKSRVDQDEEAALDNLAYTLCQRRSNFPWKISVSAPTRETLLEKLEASVPARSTQVPRIGFVFTGQGAQWHAMGRELLSIYPVFKLSIDRATQILQDFGASWSLLDELLRDAKTSQVSKTLMSLPLCTAVQLSLVDLLSSWGIHPSGVTGHSSGEVAAAYAAGGIDFRSAMAIVYFRGKLTTHFQDKSKGLRGGMIAVGLGRDAAEAHAAGLKSGKVVIACVNSPSSVTISGDLPAIEELESLLEGEGVFVRRLKVDAAYHSHHMQPIAEDYRAMLEPALKQGIPNDVVFSSPVTGYRIPPAESCRPEHWVKNMVQPVLFLGSLSDLVIDPDTKEVSVDLLLEIGPHSALAGPIRQTLNLLNLHDSQIAYATCLVRGENAVQTMQEMACVLKQKGCKVNLGAVNFPHGEQGLEVLHDLPKYPWTHDLKHWSEPRLNKAHRLRKHAHHDLLGAPTLESNALSHTWRYIIRPSDVPWVLQHQVESHTVYPGAGFISMAIEAARQLFLANVQNILGYKLHDIQISNALIIPEISEGIEVQMTLGTRSEKTLEDDWMDFRVDSNNGSEKWIEHCRGSISVKSKATGEAALKWSPLTDILTPMREDFHRSCTGVVEPDNIFSSLRAVGINHGPLFQNIRSIRTGNNCSVSSFSVADTARSMPYGFERPHVVHPTTLDAIILTAYNSLPGAGSNHSVAMIPTSVKSIFVSEKISSDAGHQFESFSTVERFTSQGFKASVTVADVYVAGQEAVPVVQMDGLQFSSLGSTSSMMDNSEKESLCFRLRWDYDVSFMSPEDLSSLLEFEPSQPEIEVVRSLRHAAFHYINDAVRGLTVRDVNGLTPHLKRLYGWMKVQITLAKQNNLDPQSAEWPHLSEKDKSLLFASVGVDSVNGQMLCCIGPQLPAILRSEVSPLQLMMKDRLLFSYYEKAIGIGRSYSQVQKLVKLLAYKNPKAKILEIGAGTGGCTQNVLEALGSGVNAQFGHYDFTDISTGFFESARERFGAWGDLLSFKKLNVEIDPAEQSFECGTYDLIIACQVLHATKSLQDTMTNVRKLLKPGGRVVMLESTKDAMDVGLVFGTLPGWWLGEEEERRYTPSLTVPAWESVLKSAGFNGLDVQVKDCEDDEYHSMSVIMSTAQAEAPPEFHSKTVIVHNGNYPAKWLDGLMGALTSLTGHPTEAALLDEVDAEDKVCILIGEMAESMLSQITKPQFDALQQVLTTSKGVLWVSSGGTVDCERPNNGLHSGLLRTLRCEDSSRRYISLDLEAEANVWTANTTHAIVSVFKAAFDDGKDVPRVDFEYARRGSSILVPRVERDSVEDKSLDDLEPGHSDPELQLFQQPGRPLRLELGTPGLLDTLSFRDDPVASEPLPDDIIEIEPKAFGVNFRDILIAMGQLDETVMGYECSGVVTRVGASSAHSLKVGDRVCALTKGYYANLIRVHWTGVGRIHDDMTFEVASTILMVFVTVHYSLVTVARLQKGETILIHAGTGGVGQAAIMLAKMIGAEVFTTVSTKEKRDFVADKYQIAHDHIFSSRDPSFAAHVMEATNSKGVDVVLNSLAGSLLQESWNCTAILGRFVELGKRDIELNKRLEMGPFNRSVSFHAVDLTYLIKYRGVIIADTIKEVINLLTTNAIQPVQPITVYPISALEQGYRLLQAGKHLGKVVIKPNSTDMVKVLPQKRFAQFSNDSSYLVVGGLGGIGQSIVRWMAERGVKNIILLSRSATVQPKWQKLLDSLAEMGSTVLLKSCDVADVADLKRVLGECAAELPPIRGVIQAAMVLRDFLFEGMSYEDYWAAVRPKVQGSWNIHEQIVDLDFFVLLSSIVGVGGNAGQSNYSAGGTFLDAFARYRTARGLPATSIDLGMVRSVGYVAETAGVEARLAAIGYKALEEDQVLRLVESAIANSKRQQSCQIITGISTGFSGDQTKAIWLQDPRFSGLQDVKTSVSGGVGKANGEVELSAQLPSAATWKEAVDLICIALMKKLSDIFMTPVGEINNSLPVSQYGVDSLVAVELRNWLVSHTKGEVSIFDILQSSSLSELADKVAKKSRLITIQD